MLSSNEIGNIRRVLVKISGESLSSNFINVSRICSDVKSLIDEKVEVSIVIGGGNIVRGRSLNKFQRETVDSMGMLATAINGLALQDEFRKIGINSVVLSQINLPFGIENSSPTNIQKHIENNNVVIFVGGAGVSYFSTDTIAVINAIITRSDVLLKATKTDGIYDKDPAKFPEAIHIEKISHAKAIEKNLQVIDRTAFSIAMEHNLPIIIFSINEYNCFVRGINGSINRSLIGPLA
jgi:uridylate kinase